MAATLEEIIRRFQLPPPGQQITVDSATTTGNLTVRGAAATLGGSGYAVDDTWIPAGGAGLKAVLRVTRVDGSGAITGIEIENAGSYTIFPTSPVGQLGTSGTGTGALIALSSNAATASRSVISAIPSSRGRDYQVDDLITLAGGAGTPAVLKVTSVDRAGGVLAALVQNAGDYSILPDNPVAQDFTNGTGGASHDGGSGATFTLTPTADTGRQTTVLIWGDTGKLPSPVSDTVGISICTELYEEQSRKTHDVTLISNDDSDLKITDRRVDSMKLKKNEDKNLLKSSFTAWVGQAFDEIGADVRSSFEPVDDTQQGKCDINWTFHFP